MSTPTDTNCKVCNMPAGKCRPRWAGDTLPHVHESDKANAGHALHLNRHTASELSDRELVARIQERAKYLADIGRLFELPFNFTPVERDQFDAYLVSLKHPLAFEAGTQESRMVRYAEQHLDEMRSFGRYPL